MSNTPLAPGGVIVTRLPEVHSGLQETVKGHPIRGY
jgi:hypothetical protein